MFDRRRIDVLSTSGTSNRDQRLAGRVRDEMKMKKAGIAMWHRRFAVEFLWINGEKATPVAEETAPPRTRCMAVHIDTGRPASGRIDSVVLVISKNSTGSALRRYAKQFQYERFSR